MDHRHASHDVTQVTTFEMPADSSASDAVALALLPHAESYEWAFDDDGSGTIGLRVAHPADAAEAVQAEVLRSHPKITISRTVDA